MKKLCWLQNKNLINSLKKEEGIGLVEAVFALGVSVVVISALVSLSIFTLRSSLQSKLLMQGTKLATQELELVRGYRDTHSWPIFLSSIAPCYPPTAPNNRCSISVTGSTLSVTTGPKTQTVDNQTITVYFYAYTLNGGNPTQIVPASSPPFVRIAVTTVWTIGDQERTVHNYTDLSNWR